MKLTLRYVDFFIISKTYHNGYSPWQVNLALKVPGVKAVIAKKMEAANKLLSQFKPKPIVDEKITLGMTP
jgi:hypothetical protein